jgi:hypothetical protein
MSENSLHKRAQELGSIHERGGDCRFVGREDGTLIFEASDRRVGGLVTVARGRGGPLGVELEIIQLLRGNVILILLERGPFWVGAQFLGSPCLLKLGAPRVRDASERQVRRRPFIVAC